MLFFILLKIKKCNNSNAIFISSLFLIYQDYDYEEPKKEGKGGKCMKGNRCGKAEKDSKDSKKEEKGTLHHIYNNITF